jgi:hypothetical protein
MPQGNDVFPAADTNPVDIDPVIEALRKGNGSEKLLFLDRISQQGLPILFHT